MDTRLVLFPVTCTNCKDQLVKIRAGPALEKLPFINKVFLVRRSVSITRA
jgi:hypothetical protein